MRWLGMASMVLAVVAGTPLPLRAQADEPPARKGFWISFGLGFGSAQAQCDECLSGDRVGSVSGTIRLGGTIGKHWLLGWEGSGWLRNNATNWLPLTAGADETLGNSSLVALYYPGASSGFFVRAGAGLSFAGFTYGECIESSCSSTDAGNGVGFGLVAGVGYDIRVGHDKSLTPEFAYAKGFPRDLHAARQTVATGWSHDYWAVNLCFTFH
jgi:hypothetical protein